MSKMNKKAQELSEEQPEQQETPQESQEAQGTPETPEEQTVPEETETQEATDNPKDQNAENIEELEKKLAETNDKYLRMLAEYDNYRRRSQKEREGIYDSVRADTVLKFLPVYDNLVRAVQNETNEQVRKGVAAILTQFSTLLTSLGVKEIEAVGKKFDPALHEALLHIEDEKYGEGEIVMELEKGFMLGDKVIRFAKVQVAN